MNARPVLDESFGDRAADAGRAGCHENPETWLDLATLHLFFS
jgi:hypothetical protein